MLGHLARLWLGRLRLSAPVPRELPPIQLPHIDSTPTDALAAFLEAAPDGIVMVDAAGIIRLANDQVHRTFGYEPDLLTGQPIEILIPERFRRAHVTQRSEFQRAPETRRMGSRMTLTARRADGSEVPVDIALGSVVFGDLRTTLAFIRDASEQQALWDELAAAKRRLETELEERQRYRALTELLQTLRSRDEIRSVLSLHMERLFPQTHGSVCLLDAGRNRVETLVNWGGSDTAEVFDADECIALRLGRMHDSQADGENTCRHCAARGPHAVCVPMTADGEILGVFHLQAETHRAAQGDEIAGLSADALRRVPDVAERLALPLANIQLRDRLLNQSVRDPLTGAYNRRHMDEVIAREISRASRLDYGLTVAMVDIDHFKRFNDTLGHDAGDQLLRAFAQFLASHVRLDDTVFRYGGEEFALVLPGADAAEGGERLEQLRELWREQMVGAGTPATFSAGVAEFPSNGSTSQEVLRSADGALYEAKASGRDRITIAGRTPETRRP